MRKKLLHHTKKNIFVKAAMRMSKNHGIELSGWLAYLNIFSIFPFLFILVSSISFFVDSASGEQYMNELFSIMPAYLVKISKPHIEDILNGPKVSLLSFVFLGAIWTASSSVESLKQIFNKIFDVKDPPNFFFSRIRSIIQFLSAIFIIITLLLFLVLLPSIDNFIREKILFQVVNYNYSLLRLFFLFVILILVLTGIYCSLTNKKLKFKNVIPGSAVACVIWFLSAKILNLYIRHFFSQFSLTYGSLATIIIVLIFFYIVNFALLYGAEINYQIDRKHHKDK